MRRRLVEYVLAANTHDREGSFTITFVRREDDPVAPDV
jgi:hypothetical protein